MAVSRRLRFEILKRDGHTCRYCGAKAPDVALTVDHVIPVTLGGSDDPTNLVTACQPCNAGKSSVAPDAALVADVDATALLFAQAIERVSAQRRLERQRLQELENDFVTYWREWHLPLEALDAELMDTLARFVGLGLDSSDLMHFVDVTAGKLHIADSKLFRYFCGCCWTEIRQRQDMALNLIEDESAP